MKRPLPEPAPRPPVRLSVTVPAKLGDLLRQRRIFYGVSTAEAVRIALWRWFGMPASAGRKR